MEVKKDEAKLCFPGHGTDTKWKRGSIRLLTLEKYGRRF